MLLDGLMTMSLSLRFGRLSSSRLLGFFALNFLHHRRRAGFGLLHLDDEVAQDGVVELERVFELVERSLVALDVHADVVSLREFLDHVGQLAAAPVFNTVDLAAVRRDRGLLTLDHRGHLLALIGVHDESDFVMTHYTLLVD